MKSLTVSFIIMLGLFVILSKHCSGSCTDADCWLPKPSVGHLEAINDTQSLVVSWPVKPSGLVGNIYEVEVSRTEEHHVIYRTNVSVSSGESPEHTWRWISDVPLECADHSVRIRNIYNRSVVSPWSNYSTNPGVKAKEEAKIFPFERMLREGSTVIFCCVPPAGVNIKSMKFRGIEQSLFSIGGRVKAITVKNLTIPNVHIKHLLLSCTETTGDTRHSLNFVSFPPQKPRNISCVTLDMATVHCTWDSGEEREPDYRNKQIYTLHIDSIKDPVNCTQSSCSFPAVPRLQKYNISVVVKNMLGEERQSYSFNISERVFPVVEKVRVNTGVTNATVFWSLQANLTQMNLLCQVSTAPPNTTELRCNSLTGLCKIKVEDLLPNTKYSVKVSCSVSGRLWGEWTPPSSFMTLPLVSLDLWRRIQQLSVSHIRRVTLLWKPHIFGTAATVTIQSYKVQLSQEGQIRTESVEGGENRTEVSVGPGRCDITVQAVLHSGSSVPAHITIPPINYTENIPIQKRLSSNESGGLYLQWNEQNTVTTTTTTCSYTVEWCILGNAVPCSLQWIKVPEGDQALLLPAKNFKAGCRYTFKIYGCTESGYKLLETHTGYSQELQSVPSAVLVEPIFTTSSSVTLEWRYNEDDPALPAFITGYLVTVQEAQSGLFNISVSNPRVKSVTVEDLHQNQEYICSVSALTTWGPGPSASITIRTRTNYILHLVQILTPLFLLLGCGALFWSQRKLVLNRLKELFAYPVGMSIKHPEFDSFLSETDQKLQSQKPEECLSCDIEIVNIRPPVHETTVAHTSVPTETQAARHSPPREQLQETYIPQSAVLPSDAQQQTGITNKSYLYIKLDKKDTLCDSESSFEHSECSQESCEVIYGYIANDTV
ncbi:leukemia inhibitory factor receptor isoform 2-T2 [Pholidichthys leucotaenia]